MKTNTSGSYGLNFMDPFFIGWDGFINNVSHTYNQALNTTFPPYNVYKTDEDTFVVEMAVAGYSRDDIEVTEHNKSLIVQGTKKDREIEYLHKGISSKTFKRSFSLGDDVHVKESYLNDGILEIVLLRHVPEEKKPKQIKIK